MGCSVSDSRICYLTLKGISVIESDLLFLNEIGLDPGLDHLTAMELRNKLEAEERKIVSFISWCGGLPAPEDSNVSWCAMSNITLS